MLYTLLGIRKLLKQRGALLLRVLRATDPHAREILERAEALSPADLTRLHGAIRELRVLADDRAPDCAIINGAQVRRGSAVRLHPHGRADAFDMLLAGKLATVESIEQDFEQRVQLAVIIDEDPGSDQGMDRMPGHRFFFAPVCACRSRAHGMSVLVAGIGNIFPCDDAFGIEVVRRLATRSMPDGVRIVDFGIRGFDLANALIDSADSTVLLVDATPRGGQPGMLYLLEPSVDDAAPAVETHGMDPANVLRLVHALGGHPLRVLVVGCEPGNVEASEEGSVGLSPQVEAAVDEAIMMIQSVLANLDGSVV